MFPIAKRLDGIGEYYFSQKLREIDRMNREGNPVINLGIGSPDLPPHPDVVRVLQEAASRKDVHGYQSYKGLPRLREAIAGWYNEWYGVNLDPESEILPLIGSKEGIMHVCMTYLNPGDYALVPDPGYPTYQSAVKLAGAQTLSYTLSESNRWYPDFEQLKAMVQDADSRGPGRVRLIFVNYPHMPTGQLPEPSLFENLVRFAATHELLIVHDNPYSFILNDQPMSLLAVPGAKDHCVELNSLSKSHNMAGWRVGMLCGAGDRIREVLQFKSNMDSGMFLPLQLAAARALSLGRDWHDALNAQYRERREHVFSLLDQLGCDYDRNQAGLFVWARVPDTGGDGFALSDAILHQARVFITPGGIFGNAGIPYIRISLCSTNEKISEAANRIQVLQPSSSPVRP